MTVFSRIRKPWWLVVPLAAWIVAFFAVPVFLLIYKSFQTYYVDDFGLYGIKNDLTLNAWDSTVFTQSFWEIWWQSVKIGLIVTVVVLAFVFPYTYAIAFYIRRRRNQFIALFFTTIPFFVSYVMQVYAWQPVLSGRGILHQGSGGLIPAFLRTPTGMEIGLACYVWPIATLLMYLLGVSPIDRRYCDAAANLGASHLRGFFDVVVRLSKPGIIMAGMLTFVITFSDLLSARFLGAVTTLSDLLLTEQSSSGNTPAAAAVSVVMLATILIVIVISIALGGRISLPGATGRQEGMRHSGITVWLWRCYIALGLVFVSIPPIILAVYGFFGPKIPVWPIPYFSTDWYALLFHDSQMLESMKNSVKVAVAVGIGSTVLGGLAGYYLARFRPRWALPYTLLVVAPAVAPPLILSLGLLVYFVAIGIWGSLWSIAIAHIGLTAVFSLFIINNRITQMNPQLEDAAANLGASKIAALRDVTLPLVTPALIVSFVVSAGLSFGESVMTFFLTATTYTWPAFTRNVVVQNTTPEIYAAAGLVYGAVTVLAAAVALALVSRHMFGRGSRTGAEQLERGPSVRRSESLINETVHE